ncbi:MAG TPA: antibiotic biosynthesis monooxygenase family protein [Alphaproteobacteria bacterium]|nr:antibiotic biosynthesis monooxygenase family protein [Alphaproteobacteria bacterium]
MTVARVILINVPEEKRKEAERVWKTECAPLMVRQQGCLSEKFMKSIDRPELYISYSEWDSMDSINKYREGADHKIIQSETRGLQGARAVVWSYEILE